MNLKLKAKSRKLITVFGFTLIELLVVIAIISLLSSIVFASLSTARNKAKDAAIKEDLIGIRTSAALYFADENNYGDPYYAADPDPYGHTFHVFFPELCPSSTAVGSSMFHFSGGSIVKSINEAIQHAGSLTRQQNNLVVCGSNSSSCVVAALLNEKGTKPATDAIFCIDSRHNIKTYYDNPSDITDNMLWNGTVYGCP